MRLRISRRAALPTAFVAAAARVLLALSLENAIPDNGLWIAAALGSLLALPPLAALDRFCGCDDGGAPLFPVPLALLLLAASALDAGAVLSTMARSAGFLATGGAPLWSLVLPICAAILWGMLKNGDAIGYGATLWLWVFPALLLLVVLLQAEHFRPEWLRPILGKGWRSIASNACRAAGCFAPASAIVMLSTRGHEHSRRRKRNTAVLSLAALAAAALLLPRLMMAPTNLLRDSWINRLDTLLTNGRAALYLQLPMIVLWHISLLHLLLCEAFAAAALLQRLVSGLDGRLCAALTTVCVGLVSCSPGVIAPWNTALAGWLYWAWVAAIVLCLPLKRRMKGGEKTCEA